MKTWKPAVAGEEKVGGPSHDLTNTCREEETLFSGNSEMLSVYECSDWEVEQRAALRFPVKFLFQKVGKCGKPRD